MAMKKNSGIIVSCQYTIMYLKNCNEENIANLPQLHENIGDINRDIVTPEITYTT